jgi:F-type H+-transporting ATPase subunit epsilon
MPIHLDVVAVDRTVYSDDVDQVIAPGIEGEMGILPRHAALMTALNYGDLVIKKSGQPDLHLAIGGGFMEVRPDRVTVLADSADQVDEIDIAQAEEARRRAQESLERGLEPVDEERALAALKRAKLQLKLAERHGGGTRRRPSVSS